MNLVKVKNFANRLVAEQAQQFLRRAGIHSVLQSPDLAMQGAPGMYFPGGVDLYVAETAAQKAGEIFAQHFPDHAA